MSIDQAPRTCDKLQEKTVAAMNFLRTGSAAVRKHMEQEPTKGKRSRHRFGEGGRKSAGKPAAQLKLISDRPCCGTELNTGIGYSSRPLSSPVQSQLRVG